MSSLSPKVGPQAIPGFSTTVSVTRRDPGSYLAGRYVPGSESVFAIDGVVQPLREGDELADNEEGRRTDEDLAFWTLGELRTAGAPGGPQPDLVTYEGEEYSVRSCKDWNALGGYRKYWLAKVGQ